MTSKPSSQIFFVLLVLFISAFTRPAAAGGGFDLFEDVGDVIGEEVDEYFSVNPELMLPRSSNAPHTVDRCGIRPEDQRSFTRRLAFHVDSHLAREYRPRVDLIGSYFGVSSKLSSHHPMSLKSHPLCRVTKSSLSKSIGSSRLPSQEVIQMLNTFSDRHNRLRTQALAGGVDARKQLTQLWVKVADCLSYVESLSEPDTSTSEAVARRYAPKGYRKPSGVKFYEDPYQPSHSRLNIGLFQFTPNYRGNVQTCIRQWNEWYPQCQVNRSASRDELIRVLGSTYQNFNGFCGVNKLAQSFAIQINTSKVTSTHEANKTSRGLKAPDHRCVSPFFAAGKTYNHFGPLQNSTGRNLKKLMACVL